MIFASCSRCGYAMDIFQELSQLVRAPLACPRCGELELKLQTTDDFEAHAVDNRGTQAVDNRGMQAA
jgi:Zn finger protein HypA/HybF involved in hydrogenase expression